MPHRADVSPLLSRDRWSSALPARPQAPPSMRAFGIVLLLGFGLLGTLSYLGWMRGGAGWRRYLGVLLVSVGVLVFVWSIISPRTLPPLYRAWMSLGQGIGAVVSSVLLTIMYFGVAMPVGLLMRLSGNDPLERTITSALPTYWKSRTWKSDRDSYRHMS